MEPQRVKPGDPLDLPTDTMFERQVIHAGSRVREVQVRDDTDRDYTGFLAGIDQDYIQLIRTIDQTKHMFERLSIKHFGETGKNLRDYENDGTLTPSEANKIRERVNHFRDVCNGIQRRRERQRQRESQRNQQTQKTQQTRPPQRQETPDERDLRQEAERRQQQEIEKQEAIARGQASPFPRTIHPPAQGRGRNDDEDPFDHPAQLSSGL